MREREIELMCESVRARDTNKQKLLPKMFVHRETLFAIDLYVRYYDLHLELHSISIASI